MTMSLIHITDDTFDKEVLKSKGLVLVDFWADWCGPCLMLGPTIEELASTYEGKLKVCKMDTQSNPLTPSKYDISGIPTVILFKDGVVMDTLIGLQHKDTYVNMIESHL